MPGEKDTLALGFPPFCFLALLVSDLGSQESECEKAANLRALQLCHGLVKGIFPGSLSE